MICDPRKPTIWVVAGGIFLLNGEQLVEMCKQAYHSEDLLSALLAQHPALPTGGDQLARSPRRWLLVKREVGVSDREVGGSRWLLDHLFVDQEASPPGRGRMKYG